MRGFYEGELAWLALGFYQIVICMALLLSLMDIRVVNVVERGRERGRNTWYSTDMQVAREKKRKEKKKKKSTAREPQVRKSVLV